MFSSFTRIYKDIVPVRNVPVQVQLVEDVASVWNAVRITNIVLQSDQEPNKQCQNITISIFFFLKKGRWGRCGGGVLARLKQSVFKRRRHRDVAKRRGKKREGETRKGGRRADVAYGTVKFVRATLPSVAAVVPSGIKLADV